MQTLTHSVRIRLSDEDLALFKELKRLKKKPTTFIREAFRDKINNELPKLIAKQNHNNSKQYCPF